MLFSISFLTLINCSQQNKKTSNLIKKWQGKEVFFPNDSLFRNDFKKYPNPLMKKLKIFIPINGDCNMCIDELEKWKLFIEKDIDTSIVGLGFFDIYI